MRFSRALRSLLTSRARVSKVPVTVCFFVRQFQFQAAARSIGGIACHPPPPEWRVRSKIMSLFASSSNKALESPFSHKDLYGVEHPAAAKGRRKSKSSKHGKSSKSKLGSARSSVSSLSSSSRHRSKDGKSSKTKAAATASSRSGSSRPSLKEKPYCKGTAVVSPITSPPSREFSLATVEADSPNAQRHCRRGSKAQSPALFQGQRSSSFTLISGSKSSDRNNGSWRKQDVSEVRNGRVAASVSAHAAVGKSVVRATLKDPASTLGTSISRLSLKDSVKEQRAGVLSSAVDVRFHRTLPPHLRVPRQAFGSSAGGLGGRGGGGGRGKSDALTISEIAKGLAMRKYQHVVVMSGAGISTPSGIPDFR